MGGRRGRFDDWESVVWAGLAKGGNIRGSGYVVVVLGHISGEMPIQRKEHHHEQPK